MLSIRRLAQKLVEQARPTALLPHSRHNHHVRGLDYVCLHRSPELTVKAYIFDKPQHAVQHTENDTWLVWPHNHRYAFDHLTLTGRIDNIIVDFAEPGSHTVPVDIIAYDASERAHEVIGQSRLTRVRRLITLPGDHFSLDPLTLHTIQVENDSVAIQVQYGNTRRQTILTSPRGFLKNQSYFNPELNQMMSSDTISKHLDRLNQLLST